MHLANRTGSTEIYAAGEAKKGVNESGQNTFEFNLLSGTYTRSLLNNINNNNKRTAASNAIITLAKEAFSSMGFKDITYDESLRTYISQKMNPTAEELQLYKAVGYDIFLCDTKESCNPVFQIAKLEGDKRAQEAVKRYYKENPEKLAEIDKTIAKIDLEIEELRKPCPKMAGGGSRRRRHRRTRRKH
jgi:membrane-anchored protein YejM (alkaline phosphatase superfamily)